MTSEWRLSIMPTAFWTADADKKHIIVHNRKDIHILIAMYYGRSIYSMHLPPVNH
jgi:hypothetical protein